MLPFSFLLVWQQPNNVRTQPRRINKVGTDALGQQTSLRVEGSVLEVIATRYNPQQTPGPAPTLRLPAATARAEKQAPLTTAVPR